MLNYHSTTTGKKQVIFIHGNSQSSAIWNKAIAELTHLNADYKSIAIDLPGHGKSERSNTPEQDYAFAGLSKALKDTLSVFEKEEYIVIASSLGANLIGEIAATLTNCKGILLMSSSAIGKGLQIPEILKPNPNAAPYFMPEATDEQLNLLANDVLFVDDKENKELLKNLYLQTDKNFRASFAASVGRGEFTDELVNIEYANITLAAVYGTEDKLCYTDCLDKANLKLWNSKTVLIPNAGHCPQLDNPIATAKVVEQFVKDCLK